MDTSKFYDWFQPEKYPDRIHIIGCGAVGSTLGELLVRMGFKKFTLYDFDIVESHNIANQMFTTHDIGVAKTEALANIMRNINPDIEIRIEGAYEEQSLNGYVFMGVDSIALRRKIVEQNMYNINIKYMFDTRLRLTDGQTYAVPWNDYNAKNNFLNSMNFTDEEALADTPVSACNTLLNVAPTVRIICSHEIANFINILMGKEYKRCIIIDAFNYSEILM